MTQEREKDLKDLKGKPKGPKGKGRLFCGSFLGPTEGRGVRLCWEYSKTKGPTKLRTGRREPLRSAKKVT